MSVDYTPGLIVGFTVFLSAVLIYFIAIILYWLCKIRGKKTSREVSDGYTGTSNTGFQVLEEENETTRSDSSKTHKDPVYDNDVHFDEASKARTALSGGKTKDDERSDEIELIEPTPYSPGPGEESPRSNSIPEEVLEFNAYARLGEGSIAGDSFKDREPRTFPEEPSEDVEETKAVPGKLENPGLFLDSHSRVRQSQQSAISRDLVMSLKQVFEPPGEGRVDGGTGVQRSQTFTMGDNRNVIKDDVPRDETGEPLYSQLSLDRRRKPNRAKKAKTVTFREPRAGREDADSIISDPPEVPEKPPDI